MCVYGAVVENVILSNLGRAGPTERVALCPVSETPRLKIVLGHQEHGSVLDTTDRVSSQGGGLLLGGPFISRGSILTPSSLVSGGMASVSLPSV